MSVRIQVISSGGASAPVGEFYDDTAHANVAAFQTAAGTALSSTGGLVSITTTKPATDPNVSSDPTTETLLVSVYNIKSVVQL